MDSSPNRWLPMKTDTAKKSEPKLSLSTLLILLSLAALFLYVGGELYRRRRIEDLKTLAEQSHRAWIEIDAELAEKEQFRKLGVIRYSSLGPPLRDPYQFNDFQDLYSISEGLSRGYTGSQLATSGWSLRSEYFE
ncbi:MAG: hypothetical protein AAGA30_04230 [Planctomycetota bacterium]